MCNGTWVCFDCRVGVRRRSWRLVGVMRPWLIGSSGVGEVLCPRCRGLCQFLGTRIEIPPRGDARGWVALRDWVCAFRIEMACARFGESVRRRHAVERRIRELEGRGRNAERDRLVKELKRWLAGEQV